MSVKQTREFRIIRSDYELMGLNLSTSKKGEAIERLIKVELETEFESINFGTGIVRSEDGSESLERDLIAYSGEVEEENGRLVVPSENVVCGFEIKTDLSVSAIENDYDSKSANEQIAEFQTFVDAPVFLIGIRHANTLKELRDVSIADETVAFGTLREAGDALKMANIGEFDRLISAVRDAVDSR